MMEETFDPATAAIEPGITCIAASAGTGKTYTLAALYLRSIGELGLEVGSILVTTFTIPATAELRDRIRARLRGAMAMFDEGPGDDPLLAALHPLWLPRSEEIRPRLKRALDRFDEAAIFTIHGFCQRLLQEHALESGVTFDAELLTDQSALLREVSEDFWRNQFYAADPRLTAFALLGGLDASTLSRLLECVVARPLITVLPPWSASALADATVELLAAFSNVSTVWEHSAAEVHAIFANASTWAIREMKKTDATRARLAALDRCVNDASATREDYKALDFFAQENVNNQTARPARNPPPSPRHALFAACTQLSRARAAWLVALQSQFLHDTPAALAQRKQAQNVLSFDDLLTRLHSALSGPHGSHLVSAVRQRFGAALVDEFQDTDLIQAEIFHRFFEGHGRLWLIGDPKQAIYGFRGADVFSYLAAVRHAGRTHRLGANQRATTPLIAAVNSIFSRAPRPFVLDEIDFHPSTAAGRRDAEALNDGPPFKFWLWSEETEVTSKVAERYLPAVVADQIVDQLASGIRSGDRPLGPSDFAVLTMDNGEARAVHAALTLAGLPAVVLSNAGVFKSPDALELLALLAAMAEPAREDLLRAALATVALGNDAAALAALVDDTVAWEQVLERFSGHHADWLNHGFFAAFRRFLIVWEVRPRLLAMPDGERRLTNLLHLSELLHHAAAAQRLGPSGLAQWLGLQMHPDTRATEEHEQRLESDEAAVKVVTVHKSKGLEFNVVWVPFSWTAAGLRKSEAVAFHDTATSPLSLDLGTAELDVHRAAAERERLAEHTRLLYVALTRAKLACHFVWGNFKGANRSAAAWVLHPGADSGVLPINDTTVRSGVAALADAAPASFTVANLPQPQNRQWAGRAPTATGGEARIFKAVIPRDWAISSFSALTAGASSDLPDHDGAPSASAAAAPLTGIHAFSRGRRAGTCLHEILENVDFQDDRAIDALVAHKLAVFGLDSAETRASVSACIRRTLTVELAPGLRLAELAASTRLHEVEFHLPIGRLTPDRVRAVLHEDLPFAAFSGFLKGFIDLVFEHDGRFYIVDWKSNWLGATTEDYSRTAIDTEMRRHHYRMQSELYTVALHRFLASRLPGYDPVQHFGGTFYLFLRGLDPAHPELGIFRDTPSAARIATLDALLSDA